MASGRGGLGVDFDRDHPVMQELRQHGSAIDELTGGASPIGDCKRRLPAPLWVSLITIQREAHLWKLRLGLQVDCPAVLEVRGGEPAARRSRFQKAVVVGLEAPEDQREAGPAGATGGGCCSSCRVVQSPSLHGRGLRVNLRVVYVPARSYWH